MGTGVNNRNLMIQGTMSGAGKSLLAAAFCRIFRQDGYKAAPFKSQNMALNSYITRDGLEMGRAQVMQAEAAGIEPDVRMNPILLKPSSDTGSQVIVNGRVRGQMDAVRYFQYKKELIPEIRKAYDSLAREYDIVVLEGAGSPAEINLKQDDIVNMGMAEMVNAPVLLAGDIDRGGVFAQLFGTTELVTPEEKGRIGGLLINKFRGDPEILRPGLSMLEERTGIPVLGVIPYVRVDVDEEDSLAESLNRKQVEKPIDIAVIRLPRISNFTDFAPLEEHPALGVRYVTRPRELGSPDMIMLPGTKSTVADLLWLRSSGLEAAVQKCHAGGTPVLGICGGYQMLGRRLLDPDRVEGNVPEIRGMGLLPAETVFRPSKTRTRVRGAGAAAPFAGAVIDGYEIHMGETRVDGAPFCFLDRNRPEGCAEGPVYGTYLPGLLDSGEMTERIAELLAEKKGIPVDRREPVSRRAYAEKQYDILADTVRQAVDMKRIYGLIEAYAREAGKQTGK